MEKHPGKQLFIDDFFVESMIGAHRVLNRPRKLTVDRPLDIPLYQPWVYTGITLSPSLNRVTPSPIDTTSPEQSEQGT